MEWWIYLILAFFVFDLLIVLFVVFKRRSKAFSSQDQRYFQMHWANIVNNLNSNPSSSIIDADKLLDQALKKLGFEGTLGEKLQKAGPRFRNLNNVWFAHKLRNRYAHELSSSHDRNEARQAMQYFKQALKDLGITL